MELANWNPEQGLLALPENISLECLPQLLKKTPWHEYAVKRLDFSSVQKVDSAILALILIWANQQAAAIEVINLPEDLAVLIDLYDLQSQIRVAS